MPQLRKERVFAGSLARDAWFYEQLATWQGIATAISYGLFTTTVDEQSNGGEESLVENLRPWRDLAVPGQYDHDDIADWGATSLDVLPDDEPRLRASFTDPEQLKEKSAWNSWTLDEASPQIAVHVMELLGSTYGAKIGRHTKRPDVKFVDIIRSSTYARADC